VGNLIFHLQNQFPQTKIILNSITFCPNGPKIVKQQTSTLASPGLSNGTESRTTFAFFFFSFFLRVDGDEHFWDEKRWGRGGGVVYPIIGPMDKIK
jgi:hypothetical protein